MTPEMIKKEQRDIHLLLPLEYLLSQVVFNKPADIKLDDYELKQINSLYKLLNNNYLLYPNVSSYLKMQWLFNYYIKLCENNNIELN